MTSKEALENLGRINLGDNLYCIFEDNLLKNCCKEEYEKIKEQYTTKTARGAEFININEEDINNNFK